MFALDLFKITTVSESDNDGVFEISPLPRGYGHTLGNVIRRILLSSIPGSAVTAIKVSGAQHEYTTLAGLQDDLLAIVLRLKQLPVHVKTDEPVVLRLTKKGEKGKTVEVTAADISKDSNVDIVDTNFHITNLTTETKLDLEITVARGVGYNRASDKKRVEVGLIPMDADYNPVKNVSIQVSQARVGQQTDLDKLSLTIETNGAIKPSVVFHQAAQALSELSANFMVGAESVLSGESQQLIGVKSEQQAEKQVNKAKLLVEDLTLSNRLTNALLRSGYNDLRDLEGMSEEDVVNIKGMGAKSLNELHDVLNKYDIKLS